MRQDKMFAGVLQERCFLNLQDLLEKISLSVRKSLTLIATDSHCATKKRASLIMGSESRMAPWSLRHYRVLDQASPEVHTPKVWNI